MHLRITTSAKEAYANSLSYYEDLYNETNANSAANCRDDDLFEIMYHISTYSDPTNTVRIVGILDDVAKKFNDDIEKELNTLDEMNTIVSLTNILHEKQLLHFKYHIIRNMIVDLINEIVTQYPKIGYQQVIWITGRILLTMEKCCSYDNAITVQSTLRNLASIADDTWDLDIEDEKSYLTRLVEALVPVFNF